MSKFIFQVKHYVYFGKKYNCCLCLLKAKFYVKAILTIFNFQSIYFYYYSEKQWIILWCTEKHTLNKQLQKAVPDYQGENKSHCSNWREAFSNMPPQRNTELIECNKKEKTFNLHWTRNLDHSEKLTLPQKYTKKSPKSLTSHSIFRKLGMTLFIRETVF